MGPGLMYYKLTLRCRPLYYVNWWFQGMGPLPMYYKLTKLLLTFLSFSSYSTDPADFIGVFSKNYRYIWLICAKFSTSEGICLDNGACNRPQLETNSNRTIERIWPHCVLCCTSTLFWTCLQSDWLSNDKHSYPLGGLQQKLANR